MSHHFPSPVRWGILGCGDATERKSGTAFQRIPDSRLVAVMRCDGAKAAYCGGREDAFWNRSTAWPGATSTL